MAHGPTATETRHLRTLFALGAAGGLTDGELLERFATLRGDPAELAFAALVERHGPMVLRAARSTLLDETSAHDAFQATFLILARKARSLWVRDSLGPWLLAVANRVASQARASEARRRCVEREAARDEAFQPLEWASNDLARAIHQEIDRLPHPYRLAVVTCHLEGLTQHEAATRLGWPVGTLQSRLARGRQKLRDRLRRRGLAPSLGLIAVRLAPVPPTMIASTAKLAATAQLGGMAAGMIAPGVLAMIETTTKGMLMMKLKLGAVALVLLGGVTGSGVGLGVGRSVRATDSGTEITAPRLPTTGIGGEPEPSRLAGDADQKAGQADPDRPLSMLYFGAPWDANSRKMDPIIQGLVQKGYPITTIDIGQSEPLRERYAVDSIPTYLVVDGTGAGLARSSGMATSLEISGLFDYARTNRMATSGPRSSSPIGATRPDQPGQIRPKTIRDDEPGLTLSEIPKPWETNVRITIDMGTTRTIVGPESLITGHLSFGSGTIISSSPEESIILTSGEIFRSGEKPLSPGKDYPRPITVDLYQGQLIGTSPARIIRGPSGFQGELIDHDLTNDLALIRIRPGRKLPASPVVAPAWPYQKGTRLIAVGCSTAEDATAWDTTYLDTMISVGGQESDRWTRLVCAHRPKKYRAGGGLFTTEGYLMGVCSVTHPGDDSSLKDCGFYATPQSIRKLLSRTGLSLGSGDTPALTPIVEPPKGVGPGPLLVPKDPGDGSIRRNATEPVTPPPVSDQGQRMIDLEQKLDQVIKALEALKIQPPGVLGDFPSRRGSNPKNR